MERLRRVFSRQRPSGDMGQGHSGVDESQLKRDAAKRHSMRSLPSGKSKSSKMRKSFGATPSDTGDVFQGPGVDDWTRASAPYHVQTAPKTTRGPQSLDGGMRSLKPYEQSVRHFDYHRPSHDSQSGTSPMEARSNIMDYHYEGNKNRNSIRSTHHRRHREKEYVQSDNESLRQKLAAEAKALKTSSTSEYGSGDPSPTTSQQHPRALQSSRSDYGTGSDLSRHPTKSASVDLDGFRIPHHRHHIMSDNFPPQRPPKSSYSHYTPASSNQRQRMKATATFAGDRPFPTDIDSDQSIIRSERLSGIPMQTTTGDSPGSSVGSPRKSPGGSECDKLIILSLRTELEEEQQRRREQKRQVLKLEKIVKQLSLPSTQQRALEKLQNANERNESLTAENNGLREEIQALKKKITTLERKLDYGKTLASEAITKAQMLEHENNELQIKLEKSDYDKGLLEKQLMRQNGQTKSGLSSEHSTLRNVSNGLSQLSHMHRYRQSEHSASRSSSDSIASADRTLENVPHNSPLLGGAGEAMCSRPPSAYYENSLSTCSIPPPMSTVRTPTGQFALQPLRTHQTPIQERFYSSHCFKPPPTTTQLYRPLDVQVAHPRPPSAPRQPTFTSYPSVHSEDSEQRDEQRIFRRDQREEDENVHPLVASAEHSMLLERGRACHSGSSISTVSKSLQTSMLKDEEHTRTSTPNKLISSSTGSVTPIASQPGRGSYQSDVVIAMVGQRLQFPDVPPAVFEAPATKPQTVLETSPVSMDDGYSTLTDRPTHVNEGASSSCAMVESADGLEWDQYMGQTKTEQQTQALKDAKATVLAADSLDAVSSIECESDVWDSKLVWKPRQSPLARFSSETNLLANDQTPPSHRRKRSSSETDSNAIVPSPDIDFVKPTIKSREALFDPADLGIATLTSSDSLAFDQYSCEQRQQMTDFNNAFYSLCAKTPTGTAPEAISESAPTTVAAAFGKPQLSTDEDSAGDGVTNERDHVDLLDQLARAASSSSFSSEESNDGELATVQIWSRQLRKKRAPKDARVRYSPPRASILGRAVYKRFGDRERKAIASFDFLKDLPTDLSGISSSPASPDDERVRLRSHNSRSKKRAVAHSKRASRSLGDLLEHKDSGEQLYENVDDLKRRASLKRLSSSSSVHSNPGSISGDSSLPLSDFVGATDQSISNSSSSSISFQY